MADQISIDVPPDLAAKLKEAAEQHGRTVALEALDLLRRGLARPFSADERLTKAREYLKRSGGPHEPLTKEQVREGTE